MTEFVYNNTKDTSIQYTSFGLYYRYQPRISYKKNVNPQSRSKRANELTKKLRNLMAICRENLQYTQEL